MDRGIIENRERAQQIIDFSDIRYGNCTPTDLDGFIELNGEVFVFFEYKFSDKEMSYGQKLALERLVDIVGDTKPAILIIAQHFESIEQDIDGGNAKVVMIRTGRKWITDWVEGKTVREVVDTFLNRKYYNKL